MTFHGKAEEPQQLRPLRNFAYRVYDGGIEHFVSSHDVYFYEAGRVGFWNDDENGERILVLTTKAFQVRQVVNTK